MNRCAARLPAFQVCIDLIQVIAVLCRIRVPLRLNLLEYFMGSCVLVQRELTFPVSEYTAFLGGRTGRTSRDASGDW